MPSSSSLDLARARIDTGQVRVRDPGTVLGRRCRAVSFHRPWANLVVSGHQPVGAQSWSTAYRGLLVVHGGSQWDLAGSVLAAELGLTPTLDVARCPAGYLGTVQLDGIQHDRSPVHVNFRFRGRRQEMIEAARQAFKTMMVASIVGIVLLKDSLYSPGFTMLIGIVRFSDV